ncbi:uncharacterized protein TNIN_345101 [Trichonephila inaurata madagascariensis]|uniref:Uncharacterized protein n=1 Tax=Trichonephila inaurata madagascariensis TaxID=2747483 RepID=A0A8X6YHZ0_9ARAC|nr:uncharacterized protein TNIN_345101 [Trichonephila inaurata madagascariensis]
MVQQLTKQIQWRHVSSQKNLTDLLSRGVSPDKLSLSELWWSIRWSGQFFLKETKYSNRNVSAADTSDGLSKELKNCNKNYYTNCISVFTISVLPFMSHIIDPSNNCRKVAHILGINFRLIFIVGK